MRLLILKTCVCILHASFYLASAPGSASSTYNAVMAVAWFLFLLAHILWLWRARGAGTISTTGYGCPVCGRNDWHCGDTDCPNVPRGGNQ